MVDLKYRLLIALALTITTILAAVVMYVTGNTTGAVYFGGMATVCVTGLLDMLKALSARNTRTNRTSGGSDPSDTDPDKTPRESRAP